MKAINITAYTEDASQIAAIKALITALKIKYTISKVKDTETPYNPKFVAKIEKSRREFQEGNFTSVKKEELSKFLGL